MPPFDQSSYQVRLEWGTQGLARLAPADIVIVVDVLRFSSTLADAVAAGQRIALSDAIRWSTNGASVVAAASASAAPDAGAPTVLVGGIRNAAATARAVMAVQERQGTRASVSIIAAGELAATGELRFAVEDQLGAGAIISALCDLGIDHSSPEAAAAAEAYRALRPGLRHMLVGSGSGRELVEGVASTARMEAAGVRPAATAEAAELDAVDAAVVLSDGVFERFS
ncbi:2-phosphosulfolactate phosphatase [Microbacterium sp. NPDC089987]|uniref:2-phosphosulfolactate phosphatase n=1 Tax=Microbacterium sp. NPDC089987 TaxID=3364202 RepID=UPI00380FBB73